MINARYGNALRPIPQPPPLLPLCLERESAAEHRLSSKRELAMRIHLRHAAPVIPKCRLKRRVFDLQMLPANICECYMIVFVLI